MVKRSREHKAHRFTPAQFRLPAPTKNKDALFAKALEEHVAIFVREVVAPCLVAVVSAEIHLSPFFNVKKLKRVDERRLAGVVRADDLQRASKFDLGVIVATRANENEALRAGGHGYLVSSEIGASLPRLLPAADISKHFEKTR